MNQEENVCEKINQTGEVKTNGTGAEEFAPPENASTVLGKFKNVDALAQAYSALQAEFTRRSQRLKKLEREVENFMAKGDDAMHSGVEKLRKNAKVKRAENKRFDEFVADVVAENVAVKPVLNAVDDALECASGNAFVDGNEEQAEKQNAIPEKDMQVGDELNVEKQMDNAENILSNPMSETTEKLAEIENTAKNGEVQKSKTTNESKDVGIASGVLEGMPVAEKNITQDAVFSSEHLYEKVLGDEQVRLRIIGEYLASIGKSGAPVTCGSAGVLAAPPLRAKSIADAGGMALHYFKRKSDGEK